MLALVFVVVIFILGYRYAIRNHDYWVKRNVKHDKPLPFLGNYLEVLMLKLTGPHLCKVLYDKYKDEKLVGFFKGSNPALVVRDPELVRKIFSDTKHFQARGINYNQRKDPLLHNIVTIGGEEWRETRQLVSPGFSVAKLRAMFPLLKQCVDKLQNYVVKVSQEADEVIAYDVLTHYTRDVVGSCGFGIELNTNNFQKSNFAKLTHNFFTKTKFQMSFIYLTEILPHWFTIFFPKAVEKEIDETVFDLTRRLLKERGYKPSGRNDFIDIMMGILGDVSDMSEKQKEKAIEFIAAQTFAILLGGYETTATSITATLHLLAYYPEIQAKVQKEIDTILTDGKQITFDNLKDFTLVNMAWNEAMRLFSPFPAMKRVCALEYTIPGTDVTIDPGVQVYESISGAHGNPEFFEDVEEFRPERFASDEAKEKYKNKHVPFGEGPRKCIGLRLAEVQSISALVTILQKCSVSPSKSSKRNPSHEKTSFLVHVVEGGFPLKFTLRSEN